MGEVPEKFGIGQKVFDSRVDVDGRPRREKVCQGSGHDAVDDVIVGMLREGADLLDDVIFAALPLRRRRCSGRSFRLERVLPRLGRTEMKKKYA